MCYNTKHLDKSSTTFSETEFTFKNMEKCTFARNIEGLRR
jgi:hypothetical protein